MLNNRGNKTSLSFLADDNGEAGDFTEGKEQTGSWRNDCSIHCLCNAVAAFLCGKLYSLPR